MRDFTLKTYHLLISSLEEKGYRFYTFEQFLTEHPSKAVVLRHDIDKNSKRAVLMAEYESIRSIRASYHMRVPERRTSDYESVIRRITTLGHEIAYHYEDYSRAMWRKKYRGRKKISLEDVEQGIEEAGKSFSDNLNYLRQFYPVKVISMHGNPLLDFDNRDLWLYLDYKNFGIICEPYFDIDPERVLYLTDTGRRWNATLSNRRDRILSKPGRNKNLFSGEYPKKTFQLTDKINRGLVPELLVINTHPQRWADGLFPWLFEYMYQNIKNVIKSVLYD